MGFINDRAPNPPFNPSPQNNSQGIGNSVTLSWFGADVDEQSLTYDVFLGTGILEGAEGGEIVPYATGISERSISVANLQPGSKYYWIVIASDGQITSRS